MYSNNLTQRHKLHRQLIDVENKPCVNPLCETPYDRRQIHRIIAGGEYIFENTHVLCFADHHLEHPNSKFIVGDRVVLNGRTPQRIELARHRPRTIIAIRYDAQKQCNYYLIGAGNKMSDGNPLNGYADYWFRSYMLLKPRIYHRSGLYTKPCKSTNDKQQGCQNLKEVVNIKSPADLAYNWTIDRR